MQRKVFVWSTAAFVLLMGLLIFTASCPNQANTTLVTKMRLSNALLAAEIYERQHGVFPASTTEIVSIMTNEFRGWNGRPWKPGRGWENWLDSEGHMLDEWRRPIQVTLKDNGHTIRIYSFGKDGIDDGGRHGRDDAGRFHDDISVDKTALSN